ncbi:Acetyltransferase (GNAT) domain-containing protein [Dyella sp. OK004]|uniref:GNAT family N-acetyltransferase n=1 Tax=Dyella sp. OK004 TaxID=1855292 RepID=UPI0008E82583|nr:GNAT family N-acetyltransferase [Dyella sp. OK004]SFS13925.1 Acetyltransferase (GNAT) domain-containing protein [Dyella sp. OK004]
MTTPSTQPPGTDTTTPLLTGEHWIETLNDGSHVLVRPIRPEDRERESHFIERLSPESRHFRFLGEIREANPALLDQLVNVDYKKSMAFVALVHDNGELREVGVSRYSASGDDQHCECAVTVADDWQHRGLGVALMRHLIGVARHNGFRQMFSMDAASNEPMRDLAKYLGFDRKRDPQDAAQVIHSLDL